MSRLKYYIAYEFKDGTGTYHHASCFTQWHPFEWLEKLYEWYKRSNVPNDNPIITWYKELDEREQLLAERKYSPVAVIDRIISEG